MSNNQPLSYEFPPSIGQDQIQTFIETPTINHLLRTNPTNLLKFHTPPRELLDQVHRTDFEERKWINSQLISFINENARGYLILEAEAGLGKTTFLVNLLKSQNYIFHFCKTFKRKNTSVKRNMQTLLANLMKALPDMPMPEYSELSLPEWRVFLLENFDDARLNSLCKNLGLDYEDLPGAERKSKAMELVSYLNRHNKLHELEVAIVNKRINVLLEEDDISVLSSTLYQLLKWAAEKCIRDEKVIIVIDDLHLVPKQKELQNVLGLPVDLPDNVFIICTQRPGGTQLRVGSTPQKIIMWKATSSDNKHDMRLYLRRTITQSNLKSYLNISIESFINTLIEKSGGLWIYLDHIIESIKTQKKTVTEKELSNLPDGFTNYFINFWETWQQKKQWDNIYLPILSILAATPEPITQKQMVAWADLKPNSFNKFNLYSTLAQWQPFITITRKVNQDKNQPIYIANSILQKISKDGWSQAGFQKSQNPFWDDLFNNTQDAKCKIIKFSYDELRIGKTIQLQQKAALRLVRMNWFEQPDSPDRMIEYLDLVTRYIDLPEYRRSLIQNIQDFLNDRNDLSSLDQVQLITHIAGLWGWLIPFDLSARQGAQDNLSLAQSLLATISSKSELYKLVSARLNLVAGHLVMMNAEENSSPIKQKLLLDTSKQKLDEALQAALQQRRDRFLAISIYLAIGHNYEQRKMWDLAQAKYEEARKSLQSIRERDDTIEVFARHLARIQTRSSIAYWKEGKEKALNYYKKAANSIKLAILELESIGSQSEDLAIAYFNFADFLAEIPPLDDIIALAATQCACEYWRKSLEIAQILEIPDIVNEANEQLTTYYKEPSVLTLNDEESPCSQVDIYLTSTKM